MDIPLMKRKSYKANGCKGKGHERVCFEISIL
jgi:hypothetical protein